LRITRRQVPGAISAVLAALTNSPMLTSSPQENAFGEGAVPAK